MAYEISATDRPIPAGVLGRRRLAVSGPAELSLNHHMPRMMRRGAISYEETDATAQYIRFLGDAMSNKLQNEKQPPLGRESMRNLNLMVPSKGRRGSLKPIADTSEEDQEEVVLHTVDVELKGRVKNTLTKVDTWTFDMFYFNRLTEGRPLFQLGLHLLQKHNLINQMHLDILKLMRFLAFVEESYHPENSYHNCIHAADVTQALNCLLTEPKLSEYITPTEMLACMLAAMCHDLDHPGVNQKYLIHTSNHLAFIHGSTSLLEHHHFHQARAIFYETELLDHLNDDVRKEILTLVESMIIATDVGLHSVYVNKFQDYLKAEGGLDLANKKSRHFMLTIAVKAADISNPARIFKLSKNWSEHIMKEFYRQGDMERELELPISAYCDRHSTKIAFAQRSFFNFVCQPLFTVWDEYFNTPFSNHLCENIASNKAYWERELEKDEAEKRAAELAAKEAAEKMDITPSEDKATKQPFVMEVTNE